MTDAVSNFITSLRNAAAIGRDRVVFTHTNYLAAVADTLVRHGFLASVETKEKGAGKELVVFLAFKDGEPTLHDGRRVSKPSRRVYAGNKTIRPVRSGKGISVLSTTRGILTGREARAAKVGGEVLFELW